MNDSVIVVTGAAGFVGRALMAHLSRTGRPSRAIVRRVAPTAVARANLVVIPDLASASDDVLEAALSGMHAVVHLAGRAHVVDDGSVYTDEAFHSANVVATARLARAAVRAGVARFLLASTIKVHGDTTTPGQPFAATDPLAPGDAYARSKVEAELVLTDITAGTAVMPIVVRPPLIYGAGVRGNFLALMDAVARRRLLPIGRIANRRSILYVGNFARAITTLIDAPSMEPGAWLVADAEPLSTPELARQIGAAIGVPARLAPVPVRLLRVGARLAGMRELIPRLVANLEVDASPYERLAGAPPFTTAQGLAATARWWRLMHSI